MTEVVLEPHEENQISMTVGMNRTIVYQYL